MMRKYLLLTFALVFCMGAKAQFVIHTTDDKTVDVKGNLTPVTKDQATRFGGVRIDSVSSVERRPRITGEAIELSHNVAGIYFGDFWKEGYGDYYFILSNDSVGRAGADGDMVPRHEGGWLLYVDIWAALSKDHARPIVPEGKYTASPTRRNGAFTTEFSLAVQNRLHTDSGSLIRTVPFASGEMNVVHTGEGYDFTAHVTTTEGKTLDFHYAGPITMDDYSNDSTAVDSTVISGDVDIRPVLAQYMLYPGTKTDNYVLRLFDVSQVTDDGVHPAVPGMKLNMDLYTAKDSDLVGTYKVGTKKNNYSINEEPGVFFPGTKYATITLGSFCERVNKNLSVAYCSITGGTMTISKTDDGKYHVKADLLTDKGNKVTCDYTGDITAFQSAQ